MNSEQQRTLLAALEQLAANTARIAAALEARPYRARPFVEAGDAAHPPRGYDAPTDLNPKGPYA